MEFLDIQCDECEKTFLRNTDDIHTNNFCCKNCYYSWLSKNPKPFPSQKGVLNSRYLHNVNHSAKCQWCGKIFQTTGYKARMNLAIFCSKECRREWYAKVWSQTDEWREKSKIRAVKILSDGLISKTNSGIQTVINNILNELGVPYDVEKPFVYFSVDNYLKTYDLVIENMGTYWHCDHRKYDKIVYETQVKTIKHDKAKRTFLKNNFKIKPLYLWETDINCSPSLCKGLIKEYIKNKGMLKDYNSFNYKLKNNIITLKNNIEIPFMDFDIDDLNIIINIKSKEKTSKKQQNKWINYNCDFCGKEKEELISHYKQKNRHFCNQQCFMEYKKNKDWHRRTPRLAN